MSSHEQSPQDSLPLEASVASPSLKDALRERPGQSQGALISNAPSQRRLYDAERGCYNGRPIQTKASEVTSYALWTAAEFRTYRHLLDRVMSPVTSEAASGRVWLRRFQEKHGKEVCDMMLAEVRRLDAAEYFKAKEKK